MWTPWLEATGGGFLPFVTCSCAPFSRVSHRSSKEQSSRHFSTCITARAATEANLFKFTNSLSHFNPKLECLDYSMVLGDWLGFFCQWLGCCFLSFPSCEYWPRNQFLVITFLTPRSWLPVGTCPTEPAIANSQPPFPMRLHVSMWTADHVVVGHSVWKEGKKEKAGEPQLCEPFDRLLGHATAAAPCSEMQAGCIRVSRSTDLAGQLLSHDHTALHYSEQGRPHHPRVTGMNNEVRATLCQPAQEKGRVVPTDLEEGRRQEWGLQ